MKTSIKELQSMIEEDRVMRSLDRIVDRAVLDMKLDRAMRIKWATAYVETWQVTAAETDAVVTQSMQLGGL